MEFVFIFFLDAETFRPVLPEAVLRFPAAPLRAALDLRDCAEPVFAEGARFAAAAPFFAVEAFCAAAAPVFAEDARPDVAETREAAALPAPLERRPVAPPEALPPALWVLPSLSKPAGLLRCSVPLMLPIRSIFPL